MDIFQCIDLRGIQTDDGPWFGEGDSQWIQRWYHGRPHRHFAVHNKQSRILRQSLAQKHGWHWHQRSAIDSIDCHTLWGGFERHQGGIRAIIWQKLAQLDQGTCSKCEMEWDSFINCFVLTYRLQGDTSGHYKHALYALIGEQRSS